MKYDLNKIKEFVIQKHKNQKRKQGTPYYLHPFAVSEKLRQKGFDIDYQIAGLFHDLLEDTCATYQDLMLLTNKEIADTVVLVTKEEDYCMEQYIQRIKGNDMATMVKLADRTHNLEEALLADNKFRIRYITETQKWYIPLSKHTPFNQELLQTLENVIQSTSFIS